MKKILIFGLGRSGHGLLDYLAGDYDEILVTDDAPFDADKLSDAYNTKISAYTDGESVDLVLLSPGISPSHPKVLKWLEEGVPLQSEIDFAAEQLPERLWRSAERTANPRRRRGVRIFWEFRLQETSEYR